jgi:hypothetical protein
MALEGRDELRRASAAAVGVIEELSRGRVVDQPIARVACGV